jgi:hypothetical protein
VFHASSSLHGSMTQPDEHPFSLNFHPSSLPLVRYRY